MPGFRLRESWRQRSSPDIGCHNWCRLKYILFSLTFAVAVPIMIIGTVIIYKRCMASLIRCSSLPDVSN